MLLQTMDFNLAILIVMTIIFKVNALNCDGSWLIGQGPKTYVVWDFAVPKKCYETVSIRIQKYVPYNVTDYLNEEHNTEPSNTRVKYRYESAEVNQTKAICCEGYQNIDENHCIPVCTESCGSQGICSSPGLCTCNEGYELDLKTRKCVPTCSSECINGFCISPDVCTCHEGYRIANDNHTCEPYCNNGADTCSDLEFCAQRGVCRCIKGYARNLLDRKIGSSEFETCKPICENPCINGNCISPNVCECHENYTQVDESTCERPLVVHLASNFVVPKNCTEVKMVKRSTDVYYEETYLDYDVVMDGDYRSYFMNRKTVPVNRTRTVCRTEFAIVNQTESICCDGYQNYDYRSCLPVCSKSCEPHGICSMPDVCICNEGYSMDQLGTCQPHCQFECINGQCTSPNYCSCNEGYRKQTNDYICEST